MGERANPIRSVLVTGACGYIGRQLVQSLANDPGELATIVAADVKTPERRLAGVRYLTADVRTASWAEHLRRFGVQAVIHLAAVVTPGRKGDRALAHAVDVLGTRNILRGCVQAGVRQLIITTSGAAYGYYADNPPWLVETDALRGNPEFAYADHKRQIEQDLAHYRQQHPELKQLIFRPGTILGETTSNQITDLFDQPALIGVAGSASPFVLIWDQDVVACLVRGLREQSAGIYNLTADGSLSMREMATLMNKPFLPLPAAAVRFGLAALKRLGLSQYGPEQVDFIRYRPVLCNRALKEDFGYTPKRNTREVFELFVRARRSAAGE